ncbi:SpoIIE family protein phosphatase [Streptomyces sp. NPDC006733]|uniref:SpoIIE family protein phosphatase n=1 Tax=Streptomyces sp. NPDC006733 TaxID=3155460 RepID=UPI0033D0C729
MSTPPEPPGSAESGAVAGPRRGDDPVASGRLAGTVARLRVQVQQAQEAFAGQALIEQAKGILVERLHCGPREAARQLDTLAAGAGVTLLELAADIVNQAARDHLTELTAAMLEAAPTHAVPAAATAATVRMRTAESSTLSASDTQTVADSLLRYALAPLGATALAIWSVTYDGALRLAGHAGFPEAEGARWHYVPPEVATLARRALSQRHTLWTRTLAETQLPSIGGTASAQAGRVVVPAGTSGRLVGALEICWPGPLEPQTPQVRRQVEALADLCAHTLDTHVPFGPDGEPSDLVGLAEGLWDPAMVLRPHLDADGRVTDFRIHHLNAHFADLAGRPPTAIAGSLLLESYPASADPSGLYEKVEHVHATGEPFRARRLAITSLVDQIPLPIVADVSITRHGEEVLATWRIQDQGTRLAHVLQHAQRLGRIGGFEEDFHTGEITWNSQLFALCGLQPTDAPIPLQELTAHAHPDDATALGRFLRTLLHHHRPASTAFRLNRPDTTSRHIRIVAEPVLDGQGKLHLIRGAYQDISAQHWTEVALAATRDQLAHTEKESAEHNRLALQLQHAIMPPTRAPLDIPGLHLAVRYRPAEEDRLVGGDWYDIVTLPNRQVLLAVGDIAGHGIRAATSMIVLRNALRGLTATGAGPAQLLVWLNTVAHFLTEHVTATAVCALYDPDTRILRWARAGHLPPILVRKGRAEPLPAIKGILLGALPEAKYQEGEVQLEFGDTLLMYTDGLIERRDRSMQSSLDGLVTAAERSTPTLEAHLDYLLTRSNADTDDDTCLIGIQLT